MELILRESRDSAVPGEAMLVCICNRLSEARIGQAIGEGAHTPAEVFQRCGARRACPNCSNSIRGLLARAAERVCDIPIK